MKVKAMAPEWMFLIFVGITVRYFTDALDPIHEQMHVWAALATGAEVVSREWSVMYHQGSGWPELVTWAGYSGEIIAYGALALVFRRIGWFGVGVVAALPFIAFGSLDFADMGTLGKSFFMAVWLIVSGNILIVHYERYLQMEKEEKQAKRKAAQDALSAWRGGPPRNSTSKGVKCR